jgi:RimJ/RimL family protein N-acetyltransferase
MTIIVGRACRLRPLGRSDLIHSVKWRNDPAVRDAVIGYRFPVTEKMEEGWYDQVLADQGGRRASFAIEDRTDGALVGFVHLTDIDWPCRLAHFGIVIGETDRQGRGIGGEATELAVTYGFETLNLDRIELRVLDGNERAHHIYKKLGFVEEGRLRRAGFVAGAPADVIVMGLLRGEFRKPSHGTPARS